LVVLVTVTLTFEVIVCRALLFDVWGLDDVGLEAAATGAGLAPGVVEALLVLLLVEEDVVSLAPAEASPSVDNVWAGTTPAGISGSCEGAASLALSLVSSLLEALIDALGLLGFIATNPKQNTRVIARGTPISKRCELSA